MNKNDWLPATATHNYFHEPVLDWFKYAYSNKDKKIGGNNYVTDYMCQQGNHFEQEIVKLIYKKIGKDNVVKVDSNNQAKDNAKVLETLSYMKKGVYIILSGVVHNEKNKTYGVPDILIRSDIINKLVNHSAIDVDNMSIGAPKLGKQGWHYRVIDIKYMTLQLRSDGEHLLNSNHLPAYKAQLLIYNQALGKMQGYEPGQAYLLGRRWVSQQSGVQIFNDHCFDKLGVIDYEELDLKYVEMTKEALNWVRLCKSKEAKGWNVFKYPLDRIELYPNMSNHMDGEWRPLKEKIARDNYELTNLWNVGKKHRDVGVKNKVYGWKDEECCAQALGINGKIGITIDEIININRDDTKELILPKNIKSELFEWRTKSKVEFFIDFEYKNAVFDQVIVLPVADKSQLLFTIGVGYMDKEKWVFKHFTVDHLNDTCEGDISEQFIKYIHNISKKFGVDKPKCWHWSPAEPNMFNNVLLKHEYLKKNWSKCKIQWCDLLKIFKEEPIVIKGCLNFKLKSVAKAMYDHGFISSIWEESKISNGQNALIETVTADKVAIKKGVSMLKMPIVKDVIKYNEMDVKVLQEILYYLRSYQTKNNKKKRSRDLPAFNTRSVKRRLGL